jgi:hypothetical protein
MHTSSSTCYAKLQESLCQDKEVLPHCVLHIKQCWAKWSVNFFLEKDLFLKSSHMTNSFSVLARYSTTDGEFQTISQFCTRIKRFYCRTFSKIWCKTHFLLDASYLKANHRCTRDDVFLPRESPPWDLEDFHKTVLCLHHHTDSSHLPAETKQINNEFKTFTRQT